MDDLGASTKRSHRVSWVPFGLHEQHPNNYRDILSAIWENRDNLGYAYRILRDGCCDGCSLGTTGLHDWTMKDIHLCWVRLQLLRLNTMPAMNWHLLEDIAPLCRMKGKALRKLGRLCVPMVRRRGEPGFRRVSWEEAIARVADGFKAIQAEHGVGGVGVLRIGDQQVHARVVLAHRADRLLLEEAQRKLHAGRRRFGTVLGRQQRQAQHLGGGFGRRANPTSDSRKNNGVYRSVDGGATWQKISVSGQNGFPAIPGSVGRIALLPAPSNPKHMYVLIANSSNFSSLGIFSTQDSTAPTVTWQAGSTTNYTAAQGWYASSWYLRR